LGDLRSEEFTDPFSLSAKKEAFMRLLLGLMLSAGCAVLLCACTSSKSSGSSGQAMDNAAGGTTVSGVLIDQACGANMMKESDPENAASKHLKSCATKDACAASGYAVISGSEMIKFDDNGNTLAKDFLAKTDKTDNLRVTVHGARTGDTIAVTSITPG
jgi:hypothetical protein